MSHKFNQENVLNILEEKISFHRKELERYKFISEHISSLDNTLGLSATENAKLSMCKKCNQIYLLLHSNVCGECRKEEL